MDDKRQTIGITEYKRMKADYNSNHIVLPYIICTCKLTSDGPYANVLFSPLKLCYKYGRSVCV